MLELAAKDGRITAITAAMPDGTGLAAFAKAFPSRFFDVGIAEQHAVTMAAGMACEGLKPVVALYSTFAQRAYDQILHDVCLQNLPVVFAVDRTGLVGDDGATHHGVFSFSFLRCLPNLALMAPKDENELRAMLRTALGLDAPAAVFYPRGAGPGAAIDEEAGLLPVGQGEQLQEGREVTLWALGSMVEQGKAVCRKLAGGGIKAGLVNARFLKPLDRQLLRKTATECKCLVTLEENILAGGFGSAVLEELQSMGILHKIKVLSLGLPDGFVAHGNRELLLKGLQLDTDSLAGRIAAFCQG
jgi:1-deoxy-D-xylulose-5-phosphate synthase